MSNWIGWIGRLTTRGFYSIREGSGRYLVPVLVMPLALIGAFYAWGVWGDTLVNRAQYRLSPELVSVSAQPEWIHADVKAEVIRDGTLSDVDVLDTDVTVKIARAFELHAWVSRVKRVSKSFPGKIDVELDYRRPVAMVEVYAGERRWLLPVDDEAVLLPGEDFSQKQAQDFIRIAVGNAAATGPVGTRWEDTRVAGAVRIAATLTKAWQKLGLYRIALVQSSDVIPASRAEYDLRTREGLRLHWGHAPGEEQPGEASARQKLTALIDYVNKNGPLGTGSSTDLDLREGVASPVSRTARLQTK